MGVRNNLAQQQKQPLGKSTDKPKTDNELMKIKKDMLEKSEKLN